MATIISEKALQKIGRSLQEMLPDLTKETNIWIGNRRYRILKTEEAGIWLKRWKAFPEPIEGHSGAFEPDLPIFIRN